MEIKVSTRHGSISAATRDKITAKVEGLSRLFDRLTAIEITVDLEHRESLTVDLRVSAEHRHDFRATCCSNDLLGAVDQVVHKMEQQLRKYKEKIQERRRQPGNRQSESSLDIQPELG